MTPRFLLAALILEGLSLTAPAGAVIHHISAGPGFAFSPLGTIVSPGDTVEWAIAGGTHTSTSDPSSPKFWDSGFLGVGGTYRVAFTALDGPGPFPYHCTLHDALGMKDTIYVKPPCCIGRRGNANGDPGDKANVSDVSFLLNWLFGIPPGPAPACMDEANVNGDTKVNVSDVTYFLNWLFGTPSGPAPVACPA